jgi:hypothetical protein
MEDVENDLQELKLKGWKKKLNNEKEWAYTLNVAKVLGD